MTVVTLAPAPLMLTLAVKFRSPAVGPPPLRVRWYVPAGRATALPGAAFAAMAASRSEQSPTEQAPGAGSSVRVTVKTAAWAGRAGGNNDASTTTSAQTADSN